MISATETRPRWYRSTLVIALVGSLLLWAALPNDVLPVSLGWIGWIAPVPWLLLVRDETLPGWHPYRALWFAGFAFWLAEVYWLCLPLPQWTWLGWLALSAYLAIYVPAFVGLSRVAVHRVGVPLWLAAPVVWTGLELARAHLLTGFLMASLAHTQVHWPPVIQISDLVGEYGVDFLIVTVAAGLTSVFFPPRRAWAILPGAALLATTLAYGHFRLDHANRMDDGAMRPTVRIGLIQGNSLAEWKADPSRGRQIMDEYLALSEQAVARVKATGDRPLDLIVWPETMFRTSLVSFDDNFQLPAGTVQTKDEISAVGRQDLASLVRRLETPVLVGVERRHYAAATSPGADPPPPRRFNSAALVGRDSRVVDTYDKIHRVMFGEYIPFADWVPFLYQLTPLTGGIAAGAEPKALKLDGVTFAPNICYETAIPHVIRRQVAMLDARSETPDVLVNVTNDAWYWGSSELDHHLACAVFRAVETRQPLVIAANGGISAWIDRCGRIRAQSPRQQPDVILADVERGHMGSWYVDLDADWFAGACLLCCIACALVAWRSR